MGLKLTAKSQSAINIGNEPIEVEGDITVTERYSDASSTNHHSPAANTAAVITKVAVAGQRHFLTGVGWSYDDDPTGGNLIITDGGATVFEIDITKGGPGFIPFDAPIRAAVNSQVVVTLAAGGAGVSGIVNLLGFWTE